MIYNGWNPSHLALPKKKWMMVMIHYVLFF